MTNPIESPEAFAINWCMHPTCSGGDKPDPCCVGLAAAIRSRDAAVRREALREAADWLAAKVAEVRVVTRDCRREAIALKGSGKDWQDAFQRECLSASRCSGFADAEEHIRALATGGSDAC